MEAYEGGIEAAREVKGVALGDARMLGRVHADKDLLEHRLAPVCIAISSPDNRLKRRNLTRIR
jgi:hypothetical protein